MGGSLIRVGDDLQTFYILLHLYDSQLPAILEIKNLLPKRQCLAKLGV